MADRRVGNRIDERGFISFGLVEAGFSYFMSRQPIRTVDELRKRKVWVPDNEDIGRAVFRDRVLLSGDWDAIADLPRVEAMLERVVALDEGYDRGQAHLYLGVMRTLLPPALGGRPREGRAHFERAIALSKGRNLMAKVEFARRYARLVFDQAMHDRLLREVLEADPREPGLTLSNTLARQQARQLLATSEDYF